MWKRTVDGEVLHFYLAGINNQNFLMRDEETGTWWQQISGKAIFGKLKGATLELVVSDELSFGLWKQESPAGKCWQRSRAIREEIRKQVGRGSCEAAGSGQFSRTRTEVARRRGRAGIRRRCAGLPAETRF